MIKKIARADQKDLDKQIDAGSMITKAQLEQLARPLLAAVRRSFEDPTFVAEYERWKSEREARKRQE